MKIFFPQTKMQRKIMYVIIFIRYLNHTTSNPVQISPVKKQILLPSPRHRSHPLPLNLGNTARCVIKACKLERLQQKITCFPFCLPSGVNPINANLIYQQQIENWNASLFFLPCRCSFRRPVQTCVTRAYGRARTRANLNN